MKKRFLSLLSVVSMTVSLFVNPVMAKDVSNYHDVPTNAWYYEYVADVAQKELMTGLNENTFGPTMNLARGQFSTVIYRMSDSPDASYEAIFSDVPDGQFYSLPITWANGNGIVTGYGNGKFGPADSLTREQMVTMLYRYANVNSMDTSTATDYSDFPDAGQVSSFASQAMSWAVGNGIISGDQGRLNPQGNVSRAVCATMISRFTGGPSITPPVIPDTPETGSTYVLNTSTHKFHYPSCRDVNKIAQENYASSDRSRDELIADGYSSCGHCNP
ncbi:MULTISPECIES: S-layer homology domain-containing protein [Lachnospiraceae]|nr:MULTISPECIES: S-layer homology domain-containing protein [Clostridia]GKH35114.1 hypothetical protein CE91St64_45210 [Faecalicatena contorta]